MKSPVVPPPSLAGAADEPEGRKVRTSPRVGLPAQEHKFDDEFSPSVARFNAEQPLPSGLAEHFFYNDQIINTLEVALERAVALGLPRRVCLFPLTFEKQSDEDFLAMVSAYEALPVKPKHGEPDWLCIQAYVWVAEASLRATQGASANAIAEAMFFAGAAARELEFTRLNRRDALRGKGTNRAASNGGRVRSAAHTPMRQEVIRQMSELIESGQSQANAARIVADRGFGTSRAGNLHFWKRRDRE
jgi:hypothetical protein